MRILDIKTCSVCGLDHPQMAVYSNVMVDKPARKNTTFREYFICPTKQKVVEVHERAPEDKTES